jgi:hypothetical protein
LTCSISCHLLRLLLLLVMESKQPWMGQQQQQQQQQQQEQQQQQLGLSWRAAAVQEGVRTGTGWQLSCAVCLHPHKQLVAAAAAAVGVSSVT